MMPDETAQAADDLRARAVLPGHAGRFVLAKHSWDEPYQRLAAASEGRAWRSLTPVQGEPVWVADKTQSFNAWVALSASAVSEERAYDDFRSGD